MNNKLIKISNEAFDQVNDATYGKSQYACFCTPFRICFHRIHRTQKLFSRKYIPVTERTIYPEIRKVEVVDKLVRRKKIKKELPL